MVAVSRFSKIFLPFITVLLVFGCGIVSEAPPYNYYHLEWAAKNSQDLLGTLEDPDHGTRSFQRLVDKANGMAEERSASHEEVSQVVLDLIEWQYFFTPSTMHIPPIPLIESGDSIVSPPPGVHSFYKKYLNVYEDDYTKGIPIITSGLVPDAAMYKVKESMSLSGPSMKRTGTIRVISGPAELVPADRRPISRRRGLPGGMKQVKSTKDSNG